MHPALRTLPRAIEKFRVVNLLIGNRGIEPIKSENPFESGETVFDHLDMVEFLHVSLPRAGWRMHWSLYVDRDGEKNLVSARLLAENSSCLHVRYDAKRDAWEPAHDLAEKLPEAVQLLGARFPDDRDMTEEQAFEFIACLAALFANQPVEEPVVT